MIVVTGISIGHQILNFVYNHGKVEKSMQNVLEKIVVAQEMLFLQ